MIFSVLKWVFGSYSQMKSPCYIKEKERSVLLFFNQLKFKLVKKMEYMNVTNRKCDWLKSYIEKPPLLGGCVFDSMLISSMSISKLMLFAFICLISIYTLCFHVLE